MLNLAICDDRPEQISHIKKLTNEYSLHRSMELSIFAFDNAFLFLDSLSGTPGYDILLLDIFIPGILGTDIAKEVRRRKDNTQIIFITTSHDFAIEAFSLQAVHYLVKPITQEMFEEAMDRAVSRLDPRTETITVRTRNGSIRTIRADSILFVESANHSQTIYPTDGVPFETRESISKLLTALAALCPGQFVSPYKGYIVNFKHIGAIENERIVMRSGQAIPIVHRGFRDLKERYLDYIFKGCR